MLYYLGGLLIGIGIFLTITTMLGFARFDNIYTQIHISTINDMLGIPLAILGTSLLFFHLNDNMNGIKLLFAVILWYIITPVSSYIIIKITHFYYRYEQNNIFVVKLVFVFSFIKMCHALSFICREVQIRDNQSKTTSFYYNE